MWRSSGTSRAARDKVEGVGAAWHVTTLTAVSNANGTSNSGLICHRGLKPSEYTLPIGGGNVWTDWNFDYSGGNGGVWSNKTEYKIQQDSETGVDPPSASGGQWPSEWSQGGSHGG